MDIKSLKSAGKCAELFGCKAVIYGPPGSGKTPISNTAPRPVMLACEPGLLSMRGSNIPTWQAFTPELIDEFFKWFFHSNEHKVFDTLIIDSASYMADIYLQQAMKTNKHGLKAYGDMATNTMNHLRPLFHMPYKHTYIICKEGIENNIKRPWFPGQQLNIEVPHLYDFILHLAIANVPGEGQVKAFRCKETIDIIARNRTGNLNEFEPPDFGKLILKAMQ